MSVGCVGNGDAGGVRLAQQVTLYHACVVDPRPGRAVHCPALNACLLGENKCQARHFGHAVPVRVETLPGRPDLARIELDQDANLTAETVAYLLARHPQLQGAASKMACVGQSAAPGFGEPEEDIAAIAKQISDHAEAIYQTWKSRGLAPTEILSCHSAAAAQDSFRSALKPKPKPVATLLHEKGLERLVSDFVTEDKARRLREQQQQQQQHKQEHHIHTNHSVNHHPHHHSVLTNKKSTSPTSSSNLPKSSASSTTISTPGIPSSIQMAVHRFEHSGDTIETQLPPDLMPSPATSTTPIKAVIPAKTVKPRWRSNPQQATTVPTSTAAQPTVQSARTSRGGPSPVRPFLTRGSVAERVLLFEKCPPELAQNHSVPTRQTYAAKTCAPVVAVTQAMGPARSPPTHPPAHTTLQRHVKAQHQLQARAVHIPRFYHPHGKPLAPSQLEASLARLRTTLQREFPHGQPVPRDRFGLVTQACECPLYWKAPLYLAAGGTGGPVEASAVIETWARVLSRCGGDQAARFIQVVTRGRRDYILAEDLVPLVQDVVESHPGLTFLKEAAEFHSRYVHTVIARIYYCVNRSWSGKIRLEELRRSNLLRVIQLLEEEDDINQVTAYFSYEHFYVIYCKFWELDTDHDLFIDRRDLERHSDHALSTRIIERVFSGAVTRAPPPPTGLLDQEHRMSYTDFVWFLLSEEDKHHQTAIEYWFRCMDLDGDGLLSMYELEYFYEEQLQRMEAIGIETLPFEDCLCQMLDMIRPYIPGKITLADLKRCKQCGVFFDTFFNLEKYLDHEQRDPFASAQREHAADGTELSDWDRYAADEYELLVAEEGGADGSDNLTSGENGLCEAEDEEDHDEDDLGEDILSPNLDRLLGGDPNATNGPGDGEWVSNDSWPTLQVTDTNGTSIKAVVDEEGDYAADSDDASM